MLPIYYFLINNCACAHFSSFVSHLVVQLYSIQIRFFYILWFRSRIMIIYVITWISQLLNIPYIFTSFVLTFYLTKNKAKKLVWESNHVFPGVEKKERKCKYAVVKKHKIDFHVENVKLIRILLLNHLIFRYLLKFPCFAVPIFPGFKLGLLDGLSISCINSWSILMSLIHVDFSAAVLGGRKTG